MAVHMCSVPCAGACAERVTVEHASPALAPYWPTGGQGAWGGEQPQRGAGGWAVWGGMPGLWLQESWERAQKKAWAAARRRHSNGAERAGLLTGPPRPRPRARGLRGLRGLCILALALLLVSPLTMDAGRSPWRLDFLTRKWRGVCSVSSTQQVGAQPSKFPPCFLGGCDPVVVKRLWKCPACKSRGSPCCWGDCRPCESL